MKIKNVEGVETIVADDYALQPGETELKDEIQKDVPGSEIDYEVEYYALLDKEAKTAADRDNYKKGLLSVKGKLPEELPTGNDLQTLIQIEVQNTLLKSKEVMTQKEKEDLIKKIISENKELKLALKTKEGISTVEPGSSVDKEDKKPTKVEHWTKEQLEYFKSRGLNPDIVKENHAKYKSKF